MAENERKKGKSNPFSFKSFVVQKETPSTATSVFVKDDKDSSTEAHDLKITGRKQEDNPFSFTKFAKQDKSLNPAQEVTTDQLTIDDDHFKDTHRSKTRTSDETSGSLHDLLPDFSEQSNKLTEASPKTQHAANNTSLGDKLFESDSDDSDNEFDSKKKSSQQKSKITNAKPDTLFDSSSDSDEFSPVAAKTGAQLFDDTEHDTHSVILEDLNGLTKAELIRKIQLLRKENEVLVDEKKKSEVHSASQSTRLQELEHELIAVRSREAEDTAALEAAIQHVEANLKTSKERGIEADKLVKHLKQEVKTLQSSLKTLQSENDRLRTGGGAHVQTPSGEQLKFVSDQLNTAATNAEQSLKQLLGGVESLKLMSKTLLSVDKFQEVPPSPHDTGS